jgi:hypothetical protein
MNAPVDIQRDQNRSHDHSLLQEACQLSQEGAERLQVPVANVLITQRSGFRDISWGANQCGTFESLTSLVVDDLA